MALINVLTRPVIGTSPAVQPNLQVGPVDPTSGSNAAAPDQDELDKARRSGQLAHFAGVMRQLPLIVMPGATALHTFTPALQGANLRPVSRRRGTDPRNQATPLAAAPHEMMGDGTARSESQSEAELAASVQRSLLPDEAQRMVDRLLAALERLGTVADTAARSIPGPHDSPLQAGTKTGVTAEEQKQLLTQMRDRTQAVRIILDDVLKSLEARPDLAGEHSEFMRMAATTVQEQTTRVLVLTDAVPWDELAKKEGEGDKSQAQQRNQITSLLTSWVKELVRAAEQALTALFGGGPTGVTSANLVPDGNQPSGPSPMDIDPTMGRAFQPFYGRIVGFQLWSVVRRAAVRDPAMVEHAAALLRIPQPRIPEWSNGAKPAALIPRGRWHADVRL